MLHIAAAIIVVLALAHSFLGERYLLMRLFRRSEHLPPLLGGTDFTKNTLRFVWHLTSVMALGFAVLLVQIAGHASAQAMATMVGAALLVSGMLPLVYTRGRHLSWLGLFAAGALCFAWAASH
ncbi:MAG: hypothetical protein WKG03_09905 [Telluria sp.]